MTTLDRAETAVRAEGFLRTGDTLAAEVLYRRIFEESPPEEQLIPGLAVGSCLARRRQWTAAQSHFSALVEQFPGSGLALAYLGAVKVEAADFTGGRDDLDRAIALSPGEGIIFIKRGELFHRLGLLRQAEADFQHALRLTLPDDPTRDFCRQALLGVRAELKTAVERKAPSPGMLVRAFFRRNRRDLAAPAIPAGRPN